jgi:hypothetical protein
MACYSVLRIGPLDSQEGNASLLRSAISSRFKGSSNDDDQLIISNRYFDANVLLKGLHESINGSDVIQEDGIILIFNSSGDTNQFDSLAPIHESAEQLNRAGELLRLCVGVNFGPAPLSDGTKKSEEEYSRRVLWCLDRGYEYLEADLTEEGMAAGHEERDKEGFARVVEAISSCMWSSHVMKSRVVAAAAPRDRTKVEDADVKEDKKIEHDVDMGSATNNSDAEREAAAMASLMQGMKEIQQPNKSSEEATTQNRQQEIAFHELEQVMTEAKRIREASQSNSISDEERRQRAGDTAVRLMGLLDKLGFDDEDDEASSGEDVDADDNAVSNG